MATIIVMVRIPFLINIWLTLAVIALLTGVLPSLPAAGQGSELPEAAFVSGVIGHAQRFSLSCESRSAADWAGFLGVSIDEAEFLAGLPKSDNPDEGFVGHANDLWGMTPPRSYGVHAGPVAELLQEYGLEAEAQSGLSWDDLRAEIAAGRPVIVWVIGQMWNGRAHTYTSSSGDDVQVAPFEHTMILTGYDQASAYVIDAYTGLSQTYPVSSFLTSWGVLGNLAVTGKGSPRRPAEELPEGTYTVQRGDYLAALAQRFGVPWDELARINAIVYPYVIYPGQVLQVPGRPNNLPPTPVSSPAATPAAGLSVRAFFPLVNGAAPQPAVEARTYDVQPGDYLIALADRWGIDWRKLAQDNGVAYPYIIYPGQVLRFETR